MKREVGFGVKGRVGSSVYLENGDEGDTEGHKDVVHGGDVDLAEHLCAVLNAHRRERVHCLRLCMCWVGICWCGGVMGSCATLPLCGKVDWVGWGWRARACLCACICARVRAHLCAVLNAHRRERVHCLLL